MRTRVVRRVSTFIVFLAAPAGASAQVHNDTAEVRTAATARRFLRPNQASLSLQFYAEGATPAGAGARVALRADSVRRALMQLGIPRDSLLTGSTWSWSPERLQATGHPRCLPPTGPNLVCQQAMDTIFMADGRWSRYSPAFDSTYRAREIIEVRLSDPAKVAVVIDIALAMHITQISQIRFGVSDRRAAYLAALQEATASAREQAEAIAAASGGRLGRAVYLGTQADNNPRYSGGEIELAGVSGIVLRGGSYSDGETEITAPAIPVAVTVYGRWLLVSR